MSGAWVFIQGPQRRCVLEDDAHRFAKKECLASSCYLFDHSTVLVVNREGAPEVAAARQTLFPE